MKSTPFLDWLKILPDEIERLKAQGHPVRVPDPGTEHGRRLVLALGAEIESDELEMIAAEWLMLRPAGQRTPAMRLVEDALTASYLRRRGGSEAAKRVIAKDAA